MLVVAPEDRKLPVSHVGDLFPIGRHGKPRKPDTIVRYIVRGQGQLEAADVLTGHDLDRIVVRCDRPLPLQADGEDLGDVAEAVFEAERRAVTVLG